MEARTAGPRCPICGSRRGFVARSADARDGLWCEDCPGGSIPRERALANLLELLRPDWRRLAIHEAAPAHRGVSRAISSRCPGYVATRWEEGAAPGSLLDGTRVEDLQHQTFADASFDIVITLDVLEHVERPEDAVREIHRTLRPGGLFLATFPIQPTMRTALRRRVERDPDGTLHHLVEPEFHGSPSGSGRSLVTHDFGYDIHEAIASWAPFDVSVTRFASPGIGVVGRHTEVVACWAGTPPSRPARRRNPLRRRRTPRPRVADVVDPRDLGRRLERIESGLDDRSGAPETLQALRGLTMQEFLETVFSLPRPDLPRISRTLPAMAPVEVQMRWTGTSGPRLAAQTAAFMRSVMRRADGLRTGGLHGATILDFGCGYGRFARAAMYFTEPDRYLGLDPWEASIAQCRSAGLGSSVRWFDEFASVLPIPSRAFDAVLAFSVLTHLSQDATERALRQLRPALGPSTLLSLSVRPVGYWDQRSDIPADERAGLIAAHHDEGFAFRPHRRDGASSAPATYGDTSMEVAWLERSFPWLSVIDVDRSPTDPYQDYVHLRLG